MKILVQAVCWLGGVGFEVNQSCCVGVGQQLYWLKLLWSSS